MLQRILLLYDRHFNGLLSFKLNAILHCKLNVILHYFVTFLITFYIKYYTPNYFIELNFILTFLKLQ